MDYVDSGNGTSCNRSTIQHDYPHDYPTRLSNTITGVPLVLLLTPGDCHLETQIKAAQDSGADAVIMIGDQPKSLLDLVNKTGLTIPYKMVNQYHGEVLRQAAVIQHQQRQELSDMDDPKLQNKFDFEIAKLKNEIKELNANVFDSHMAVLACVQENNKAYGHLLDDSVRPDFWFADYNNSNGILVSVPEHLIIEESNTIQERLASLNRDRSIFGLANGTVLQEFRHAHNGTVLQEFRQGFMGSWYNTSSTKGAYVFLGLFLHGYDPCSGQVQLEDQPPLNFPMGELASRIVEVAYNEVADPRSPLEIDPWPYIMLHVFDKAAVALNRTDEIKPYEADSSVIGVTSTQAFQGTLPQVLGGMFYEAHYEVDTLAHVGWQLKDTTNQEYYQPTYKFGDLMGPSASFWDGRVKQVT